jgi:hypothetical protein
MPVREEQSDGLTRRPVLRSAHRHCVESVLWAVLALSLLVGATSGLQGLGTLIGGAFGPGAAGRGEGRGHRGRGQL